MNTSTFKDLYLAHVAELQIRAKNVLRREGLDGLVIHSGKELKIFLDDNSYPFKCNPHFKHWLPLTDVSNCWLLLNGEDKPTLIYYQPVDFWHHIKTLEDEFWCDSFDIKIISQASDIDKFLPYDKVGLAYLGEHIEVATALGFTNINPEPVLNYLHFHRAYKTDYEQACLRQANVIALKGHQAAKNSYLNGDTEFAIQQAYLQAISHSESETPYQNIIALNEHSAILHYSRLSRVKPKVVRSFLIDAGASFHGYGADITRTYAKVGSHFNDLIMQLELLMLSAVERLKPGISYLDLHISVHRDLAGLLKAFDIIKVDVETALNTGIVASFFPHGLGHHLGLQTHDVGGFMADERGTHVSPPAEHAFLRTTRLVEANQVFTIEPGIYFIPSLLAQLKASSHASMVNWQIVEQLSLFGGIRIEDNIIVHQSHNENISRIKLIN